MTTEENNKKLVLEAFDTLFNKRNYAAAERYGHLTRGMTTPPTWRVAWLLTTALTMSLSTVS